MDSEHEVGSNHADESHQGADNASLNVHQRDEVHQADVEDQSAEHGITQRVEILKQRTVEQAQDPGEEKVADGDNQGKDKSRPEI